MLTNKEFPHPVGTVLGWVNVEEEYNERFTITQWFISDNNHMFSDRLCFRCINKAGIQDWFYWYPNEFKIL